MVVSGRTGVVLQWADVPDGAVTHFSSILYERPDGVHTVLFGTGNQTQPGALWAIELSDLHLGDMTKVGGVDASIVFYLFVGYCVLLVLFQGLNL